MEIVLIIPIILSFIFGLVTFPKWIKKCHEIGLLWNDMNKYGHPKNVASSGGIVVVMSFILGVLFYIAIRTFILGSFNGIDLKIFSLISVILMLALIGLTDDLLGWKNRGLSAKTRLVLAFLASIPLVVINAGNHMVYVPFLGSISLGLLYPLIIIPLGVAGASTTYNFLAGFNGLEAGQGIIIISFLSFISYATGSPWLGLIGLIMVAALIAFYIFNRFPARVFPGDVLTYPIGALIAGMAILGNFEKIAMFIFIPYILETVLKSRGGLKKHSFGIPSKDGGLEKPYEKIYGLTHVAIQILSKIKNKVYERDITHFIFVFQIIICLIALILFGGSIIS
jgi:UDP-N-acetylglucosamine--dolichyl-phosphate N-acetylglucosaminephosphotransferase